MTFSLKSADVCLKCRCLGTAQYAGYCSRHLYNMGLEGYPSVRITVSGDPVAWNNNSAVAICSFVYLIFFQASQSNFLSAPPSGVELEIKNKVDKAYKTLERVAEYARNNNI